MAKDREEGDVINASFLNTKCVIMRVLTHPTHSISYNGRGKGDEESRYLFGVDDTGADPSLTKCAKRGVGPLNRHALQIQRIVLPGLGESDFPPFSPAAIL